MNNVKIIFTAIVTGAILFFSAHVTNAQQGDLWIPVSIIDPSEPDTNPDNLRAEAAPTSTAPTGDCSIAHTGPVCYVELNFSDADEEEILDLLDQLEDESLPNPTIQDFLDAGAKHAGPFETPVYARLLM